MSVDFNHDPRSSIFDATRTRVAGGTLVKVFSGYEQRMGLFHRMLDTTLALVNANDTTSSAWPT